MKRGKNERGASLVEYGLIIAGVVVGLIVWIAPLSQGTRGAVEASCDNDGWVCCAPNDPKYAANC